MGHFKYTLLAILLMTVGCTCSTPETTNSNKEWLEGDVKKVEAVPREFDCEYLGKIRPDTGSCDDCSWYNFVTYRCIDKKFDRCYIFVYAGDGHHTILDCEEGVVNASRDKE